MANDSDKVSPSVWLGAVAASSAAKAHAQDTVPEVYRGIYQVVKPLDRSTLVTGAIGIVETAGTDVSPPSTSLILVPAGIEYRVNDNLSFQSYLMLNNDMPQDFRGVNLSNKLEVRPVVGVTLKTDISKSVEVVAWLRYEARFRDVGGNSSFESRIRLRPYMDVTFAQKPDATSWHLKLEAEPKYTINSNSDWMNGLMARA